MSDIEELVASLQELLGERGVLSGDDVTSRPNHSWGQGSCPESTLNLVHVVAEFMHFMQTGFDRTSDNLHCPCQRGGRSHNQRQITGGDTSRLRNLPADIVAGKLRRFDDNDRSCYFA